jgi:hypothetical protein
MSMKKLIIISGSMRLLKEPDEPIPAIQRFDGVFIRLVKKYYEKLRTIDVCILSPIYGLVRAEEKINYKKPIDGKWYKFEISRDKISKLRASSLSTLKMLMNGQRYNEIYINVGKNMLKIIEDFEKIVPKNIKIVYAQGRGIGPKMAHMKKWLELNIT